MTLAGFGAAARSPRSSTAPLVGSHVTSRWRASSIASIPFADNVDAQIFFIARLPRVLAAALVGASLAAAGVVFQALLRNPLATPDTLGVSSGAALGAMLAITFHFDFAIAGISVDAARQLRRIARRARRSSTRWRRRGGAGSSTTVLLLAGVTMTAFFSALILFMQYLADFTDTFRTVRWLMGTLDVGELRADRRRAADRSSSRSRMLRDAAARARSHQPRRRRRRRARRERAARRADRARQRVAGDRRRRVARRPGRVRRPRRAAPRPADRRLRPSARAAGVGALRRGVPHRLRSGRADRCSPPVELPVGIVTALIGGPFFLWLLVRASR